MKKEIEAPISQVYCTDYDKFSKKQLSDILQYDFDYAKIEYCDSADSESLVLYIKRLETDAEYKDR